MSSERLKSKSMIDFQNERDFASYRAGDVVFSEGDIGNIMYGVVTGEVELRAGGKYLASVRENELFGEMVLLDSKERSATALAVKDTLLAKITKERFLEYVAHDPSFALRVMATLAGRLRVESKMRTL
jgi:CRP/FNR family transcriptional regulator, cyclic AMP receptor protein